MLDKQFDHIINQKIRDIKVDAPKSDWNVFSQKLKVAMESTGPEDQLFDEAIIAKVAAASIAIPKPEWGAFAPKLQDNLNPSISDTAFDAIINDKVSQSNIDTPKPDWNVFADKLADAQFDASINDKVSQSNIDTPSPDWNVFSDKLADAQFDASIKEKVENPDIEIPKPDWPIFAGLLASTMTAGHDISDAQFDSAIQDKLVDADMDIPNSDWSALSQKMEKGGLNDMQMDAEVKSKLEDYSTPYEESHWAILRDRMIHIRYLRRNLYGLKGFEAALTVLLFITFANFFADGIMDYNNPIAKTELSAINHENVTAEANTVITTKKENNTLNSNGVNTTMNTVKEKTVFNNSTSTNSVRTNNIRVSSNNSGNNNSGNTNSTTNQVAPSAPASISPIIQEESNTTFSKIEDIIVADIDKTSNGIDNSESILGLQDIAMIGFNDFATDRSILDPAFSLSPSIEVHDLSAKKNGWNVYVATGRNTHEIFTPADTLIANPAYSRKVNNLQFEIRIGKEFDDIELMTGIAYQRMEYGSNLIERMPIAQDINQIYTIDNIRYDFVKIPLSARWNYKITQKFGFFADIGLSANFLMNSEYSIDEWEEVEGTPPGTIPQPISTEVELIDPDSDFYDSAHGSKNYQKGLRQGGLRNENIFGNLDSGVGFKFKTTKGIETFARASMSQPLGELSLGPNSDSFSTWGLQLGLKFKLK